MLWGLMAHVYCVEWKMEKFQESIAGQFRAKYGHVIQAPVMLIITVQCQCIVLYLITIFFGFLHYNVTLEVKLY